MRRHSGKRRFSPRRGTATPVTWADVSGQWTFAAVAATSTSVLIGMQAPTSLASLTSDPPEDMTILRVVGDFSVILTGAIQVWTLALIVADVTWTPGATVAIDNDKRLLWQVTYQTSNTTATQWYPPGHMEVLATAVLTAPEKATHIDITPKVRIEPGKALYLVAYDNVNGASLTTASSSMRVLFKRSGRR